MPPLRFLALALVLAGCAQANFYRPPSDAESRTLIWEGDLTLDQQTYILGLRNEPTAFELPARQADAAWSRARRFVVEHAGMKVRRSDGRMIRTDACLAPAGVVGKTCDAGYEITRQPTETGARFTVKTSVSAPDWVPCEIGRRRNARILSRYMRTGRLEHEELIQR